MLTFGAVPDSQNEALSHNDVRTMAARAPPRAALAIAGPWMISTSLSYTVALFNMLPSMVR